MSDVLSLTIALGSRYPSKNQEGADGRRGGKKSAEYKQVSLEDDMGFAVFPSAMQPRFEEWLVTKG